MSIHRCPDTNGLNPRIFVVNCSFLSCRALRGAAVIGADETVELKGAAVSPDFGAVDPSRLDDTPYSAASRCCVVIGFIRFVRFAVATAFPPYTAPTRTGLKEVHQTRMAAVSSPSSPRKNLSNSSVHTTPSGYVDNGAKMM